MTTEAAGARPATALRGLHAQTVEALGTRIVRGDYAPGAALSPDELEQEFGISKTVLREALLMQATIDVQRAARRPRSRKSRR